MRPAWQLKKRFLAWYDGSTKSGDMVGEAGHVYNRKSAPLRSVRVIKSAVDPVSR